MDEFETISRLAIERGLASPEQIEACRDATRRARGGAAHSPPEVKAISLLVDRRVLTARQLERLRADTAVLSRSPAEASATIPDLSLGAMNTGAVSGAPPARGPRGAASGRPTLAGPSSTARDTPGATPGAGRSIDAPLTGRVLGGKYELGQKLGQGGMGAVYLARQKNLGRDVAIKVLPPELTSTPEIVERFTREARLSAKLSHTNVVQVHDVEVDSATGLQYLVMERVDGESLADRLKREGALDWRVAVGLMIQAARGLGAAHAAGVIHRDVKPANMMLARDGTLKVMDFGLSRALEPDGQLSRTGQILGTPHFMSPEQARGEKDLDARADVFSLGATLYSLLTGHPPFRGPSTTVVLYNVIYESPAPMEAVRPGMPAGVGRCVMATLAKERALRPAGMNELIAELERLGERTGFRKRVEELASATFAPWVSASPMSRGRPPWVAALIAVALVAIATALWRRSPDPPEGPAPGSDSAPDLASPATPIHAPPPLKSPAGLVPKPPFNLLPLPTPPVEVPKGSSPAERAAMIDDAMANRGSPPMVLDAWRRLPQLVCPPVGSADEEILESALLRLLLVMAGHQRPEGVMVGGVLFGEEFPRAVVVAGLGHAARRSLDDFGDDIPGDPAMLALFERGLPLGFDAQLALGFHPRLERVRTPAGWEHGIAEAPGTSSTWVAWRRAGPRPIEVAADTRLRTAGLSADEWRARLASGPSDGTLVELARLALAATLVGDPNATAWAERLARRRAEVRAASAILGGRIQIDLDGDRVPVSGWQAVALGWIHEYLAVRGESAKAIGAAISDQGEGLLAAEERARWGHWIRDRIDELDGKGIRGPPKR